MKSRSREIGCYNDRIALKFDSHISSTAAERLQKFEPEFRGFETSCGKTSVRLVNRGPGDEGSNFKLFFNLTWEECLYITG